MNTIVTNGAALGEQEKFDSLPNGGASPYHVDSPAVDTEMSIGSVMRTTRQGEVALDFDTVDLENPRTFSTRKKLLIASAVIFPAFVSALATPIYVASIPGIMEQFGVSETLAIAPLSLFAAAIGVGALFSTAFAELLGRTIVYKISLPLSLVFTIVSGTATEFRTLMVARALAGFFTSPGLTIAVGTLNDMWNIILEKAGTFAGLCLVLSIITGTQVGFMMGASILTYRDWRWTFHVTSVLIGFTVVFTWLIPETYKPEILRRRAKKLKMPVPRRGDLLTLFLVGVGRPLHMIIKDPIVFPTSLVLSIFQSILFSFYVFYTYTFQAVYAFIPYQIGMTFGPLLVGTLLAVPVIGLFDRFTHQKYREEAIRTGATIMPEKRLFPTMVGIVFFPLTIFWFAWSARPWVHWAVPVMSGVFFSFSYVLVMLCIPIYKNDIYGTHFGASILAADTFMRYMISAVFPLFIPQMISRLGIQWAVSTLAFILVAMIPIPLAIYRWGPALRARSYYIPTKESVTS